MKCIETDWSCFFFVLQMGWSKAMHESRAKLESILRTLENVNDHFICINSLWCVWMWWRKKNKSYRKDETRKKQFSLQFLLNYIFTWLGCFEFYFSYIRPFLWSSRWMESRLHPVRTHTATNRTMKQGIYLRTCTCHFVPCQSRGTAEPTWRQSKSHKHLDGKFIGESVARHTTLDAVKCRSSFDISSRPEILNLPQKKTFWPESQFAICHTATD